MSEQPGGEIILYQRVNAPAVEVSLDGETVWLSQQQLAELFKTSRTNVVEHIANIYAEGELDPEATCREFRQVQADEHKRLNTPVSAYFDAAEFRAMNHEPTYMKDWLVHLEQLIVALGGKTLQGAGNVSHQHALTHAEAEYAKFREQMEKQPSEAEAAYLETVKTVQKKITGKKKS